MADERRPCPTCRRVRPPEDIKPHGYHPCPGTLSCSLCREPWPAWEAERAKRGAWLLRIGFGPCAFDGTSYAADDQRLPKRPKGDPLDMPSMPPEYFHRRSTPNKEP